MKYIYITLSTLTLLLSGNTYAQDYIPINQEAIQSELIIEQKTASSLFSAALPSLSRLATLASGAVAPGAPKLDPFKCAVPPAFSDLKTKLNSRAMTASTAASLGFPVASMAGETNSTVLIQDWSRVAPCLSNDGKTTLLYGQAVRVYTSIANTEASAGLTFAAIAAEATLNRKVTHVQAELIAFNNEEAQKKAAKLLGALTVENFAEKNGIVQELVQRLIDSGDKSMALIGVQQDAPELRVQVASAYGIQQVADGRSCNQAKQRFPAPDVQIATAIETAYFALTGICGTDKPSHVAQATAKTALMELKIK